MRRGGTNIVNVKYSAVFNVYNIGSGGVNAVNSGYNIGKGGYRMVFNVYNIRMGGAHAVIVVYSIDGGPPILARPCKCLLVHVIFSHSSCSGQAYSHQEACNPFDPVETLQYNVSTIFLAIQSI